MALSSRLWVVLPASAVLFATALGGCEQTTCDPTTNCVPEIPIASDAGDAAYEVSSYEASLDAPAQ